MSEYKTFELLLENVRLDRVSLTKPYIGKDAPVDPATGEKTGNYHVDAIFDVTHPQLEAIKTLMLQAVEHKFADRTQQVLEIIRAKDKLPLHRGDINRPGKPAFAGKLFLSANNKQQPTILVTEGDKNIANRDTVPVFTPSHPKWPYSGCFANVIVAFKAYEHTGTPGVSCYLNGVQFLNHGEKLGGSMVASVGRFGLTAAGADGAPPAAQAAASGGAGLI
jgi:hypothetical protein